MTAKRPESFVVGTEDPLADPRVCRIVAEFQEVYERGRKPDRRDFMAKYPELAGALEGPLKAIEYIHGAMESPLEVPPAAADLKPGGLFGDFRIVREIGRGGMGVVYEAEQISLDRRVALKVLPALTALDERARRRFRNEAQAAAGLRHPHIVPVYGVGHLGDVHYFWMQYVDGPSLAAVVRASRPPAAERSSNLSAAASTLVNAATSQTPGYFRQIVALGQQAADALHHAHECGVIHRDVKPGNLLLDPAGDVWVVDFGLAHLPGSDLTGSADVMGTLRYMSPEQASGRAVDARTDVYSLGASLYEMLTLTPAFTSEDRSGLLHQVLEVEPPPLRARDGRVPADLDTIVRTAMAKEPAERYATAAALRDDLQRFLEDRPIEARPPGLAQRGRKWLRRNRVLAGTTASVLMVSLVAGLIGLLFANRAIDSKQKETEGALGRESAALAAETEAKGKITTLLKSETAARTGFERMAYIQALGLAQRELEAGNVGTALHHLHAAPEALRRWEWHYLMAQTSPQLSELSLKQFGNLQPTGLSFVAGNGELFAPTSRLFLWWSVPDLRCVGEIPIKSKDAFRYVHLSPDDRIVLTYRKIALGGGSADFYLWNKQTGELVNRCPGHAGGTHAARFSHNGAQVISGGADKMIRIWATDSGKLEQTLSGHLGPVRKLAVAPNGGALASLGEDKTIRIWSLETGTVRHVLDAPQAQTKVTGSDQAPLRFRPDGRHLASGGMNGSVTIWDAESGRRIGQFAAHTREISALAYSPDGRWLATAADREKNVRIWDVSGERLLFQLHGSDQPIEAIEFHLSGTILAAGCTGTQTQVLTWDLLHGPYHGVSFGRPDPLLKTAPTPSSPGFLAFSPDGRSLAVSAAYRVEVWNPETARCTHVIPVEYALLKATGLAFSPDSSQLTILAEKGGTVWDLQTLRPSATIATTTAPLRGGGGKPAGIHQSEIGKKSINITGSGFRDQVAFTADRTQFVAIDGPTAKRIDLHDAATGQFVRTICKTELYFRNLALSPDGRFLAADTLENTLCRFAMYEMATGRRLYEQQFQENSKNLLVEAMAFDGASQRIALGLVNGGVRVLNVADGSEEMAAPSGESRSLYSMVFSPDGERLFCALKGRTDSTSGIRVLDTRTGHEVLTIPLDVGVDRLIFHPNGKTLVARDDSGRIWMFDSEKRPDAERFALLRNCELDWHLKQADDSQATGSSDAEIWHLRKALRLAPDDPAIKKLLTEASKRQNPLSGEPE